MGEDSIALLCWLHPGSKSKQQRCLDLLRRSAREYYRSPEAKCTTWSYFVQYPTPKSLDLIPSIGGLEMYTTKSALQAQIDDPVFFQSYHQTVKREGLYAKPEELVAWYLVAGFVAREVNATPFGNVLISVTKMKCTDRQQVLDLLRPFAEWVRANEPDVLTYAAFTRPKAPDEVLLFIRYKDSAAMKGHNVAPEHQDAIKKLSKFLEADIARSTTLWKEVQDSFVSNVVGAGGSATTAKLLQI